jgi:hypothetical protein
MTPGKIAHAKMQSVQRLVLRDAEEPALSLSKGKTLASFASLHEIFKEVVLLSDGMTV